MVRKIICALAVMAVSFGFVLADEFGAVITAVQDGKVTFQKFKKPAEKGKKGEKDGDPVTLPLASNATISRGKFNKEEKKIDIGDKLEGGLKNEAFAKVGEKGVFARITTDADNKQVTQIILMGGQKK